MIYCTNEKQFTSTYSGLKEIDRNGHGYYPVYCLACDATLSDEYTNWDEEVGDEDHIPGQEFEGLREKYQTALEDLKEAYLLYDSDGYDSLADKLRERYGFGPARE